jgi:hypothetical protein
MLTWQWGGALNLFDFEKLPVVEAETNGSTRHPLNPGDCAIEGFLIANVLPIM